MIRYPESCGNAAPAPSVCEFLKRMQKAGINFHSILMLRGNDVVFEKYIHPFHKDMPHRMYSVTKSFVSIAVGCLVDEGKLSLDDPIIRYFEDKLPETVSPLLEKQTVRDMLMMATCFVGSNWFLPEVTDRTRFYFAQTPNRPSGTLFNYDSTGSYILGVLVERVSGMSLLDYLKIKVLNRIGGFENAEILKTNDGTPWGDSAMVCTSRALMNFAKFVMNMGTWEGERLLSEEYLKEATSLQITTNVEGAVGYNLHGYGYQIWMNERGFSFHGMGGQFAICVPEEDFIFVCTGDNQYNTLAAHTIFRGVFDCLLPEKNEQMQEETDLSVAMGENDSVFSKEISGKTFVCAENPMGIKWFRLDFGNDECAFVYENAQGEKTLYFGMKKNVFGKFPQLGYSDDMGNTHEITDFKYDCAASAGWIEKKKLQLRVQIIDRYFGSMVATFGFRDENTAGVRMIRHAEDFLSEYDGWIAAKVK